MKIFDIRCPECNGFHGFKNNDDGWPTCQNCGYIMTEKYTQEVLQAAWDEHKKDQQDEKCNMPKMEELKDGMSLGRGLDENDQDIVIGATADMELFIKAALPHDTEGNPIRAHMRSPNEDESSDWQYIFCDPKEEGAFEVIYQVVEY